MTEIQEQDKRIEQNLELIKYRIVVFSGKGGVGKSTIAVNLAYSLLKDSLKVGLLDADITGPNIPQMVGLSGMPEMMDLHQILPQIKDDLRVISIAPMIPKDQPVIWRGPLRSGTISQFLADVVWDELDVLVTDLPPGTGDEVLTVSQKMHPQLAIIVTTPQEVSLIDCRRAVNMAKKLNIPKIAVVENMSGLICPHCGVAIDFFGTGGGEQMAKEMDVTFLGRIPMEKQSRECGDNGTPVVLKYPESQTTNAFLEISRNVLKFLKQ
ncbi:Mrp/NBP35 family ATP-binding protein [bacterium]|nr:Mrp/NBP35 family ATP-binding protein [bacterium]MBU1064612.1 Mrp/NBP35 family ATP-binding protein [bacterium]MBU1635041.1 Mrp/NBP35 family ATP-binding protein [bacterium]MBU1874972.1 Mrp/NBP35 family ATP-binding protein [bacterium]